MNHSKMKWSQVNKRTHKQHDASTDLWRLKKDPVDFQDRVKTHTECNSWLMDSLWHGQCGGPAPIMRSLIKLFFVTPPFSQSSMISLWLFQQYPHWQHHQHLEWGKFNRFRKHGKLHLIDNRSWNLIDIDAASLDGDSSRKILVESALGEIDKSSSQG